MWTGNGSQNQHGTFEEELGVPHGQSSPWMPRAEGCGRGSSHLCGHHQGQRGRKGLTFTPRATHPGTTGSNVSQRWGCPTEEKTSQLGSAVCRRAKQGEGQPWAMSRGSSPVPGTPGLCRQGALHLFSDPKLPAPRTALAPDSKPGWRRKQRAHKSRSGDTDIGRSILSAQGLTLLEK